MEAALGVEQAVGGKDVEMRIEEEVIAEGVDGGHSGEAAIRQIETGAEGFEQGVGGGFHAGKESVPGGSEDLPERRGTGAAGLVHGRHKECP